MRMRNGLARGMVVGSAGGRRVASARTPRRCGFTLIEIMFALAIFAVAAFGFLSLMAQGATENLSNRQKLAAMQAARAQVELMTAQPFKDLYSLYNERGTDDPSFMNSAPGPHFDVPDLPPLPTDPDGHCGRVIFPTTPGGLLTEDPSFAAPGIPTDLYGDLNSDGLIQPGPFLGAYEVLPFLVQVEWFGPHGPTKIEYQTRLFKK